MSQVKKTAESIVLPPLESLASDFSILSQKEQEEILSENGADIAKLFESSVSLSPSAENRRPLSLRELYVAVERLRIYSTCWVVFNPAVNIGQKKEDVTKMVEKLYSVMEEYEDTELRDWYFFITGSLLNIPEDFDKRAEQLLTRAVKLAPSSARAWTELGECLYKKSGTDCEYAKTCFENALRHDEGYAPALCGLSITVRRLSSNQPMAQVSRESDAKNARQAERDLLDKSFQYASKAVECSPQSRCFLCLGNALVARFFRATLSPNDIEQAELAYNQADSAEESWRVLYNPDFYYNRAGVSSYRDRPSDAIRDYHKAASLDPEFEFADAVANKLYSATKHVGLLVQGKAGLKKKRLEMMLSRLNPSRDLGISNTCNLAVTPIAKLKTGKNSGCVSFGKIIATDNSLDCLPFVVILVDSESTCSSVCLYNLNPSRAGLLQVGDSLAIREPELSLICLKLEEGAVGPSRGNRRRNPSSISEEKELHFRRIRVERPFELLINGSRPPRDFLNPLQLTTSNRAHSESSSPSAVS